MILDHVSVVDNYREQFTRTIRTTSYDELLGRIQKRTAAVKEADVR